MVSVEEALEKAKKIIAIDLEVALQREARKAISGHKLNPDFPINRTGHIFDIRARVVNGEVEISFPYYAKYLEYGCFFDNKVDIRTNKGIVKLKDLKLGDKVFTGKTFKKVIQKEKIDIGYPIIKVKIKTKKHHLEVTEDHPIKTTKGWKRAGDLTEKDEVFIYGYT